MHPDEKHRARKLRREQTPAEKILWAILRDRRFADLKFRRQQPIGPFYVDFICASIRLIIEVDGETPLGHENYDTNRTHWLEQHGYSVVRNNELYDAREAVLNLIYNACTELLKRQQISHKT